MLLVRTTLFSRNDIVLSLISQGFLVCNTLTSISGGRRICDRGALEI